MKFNWGKSLLVIYLIFVVLTLTLVAFCMTRQVDLVSKNYYEKEVSYQEQIDKQKNTLESDVKIEYDGEKINFLFPEKFKGKNITGDIVLYRPSSTSRDF